MESWPAYRIIHYLVHQQQQDRHTKGVAHNLTIFLLPACTGMHMHQSIVNNNYPLAVLSAYIIMCTNSASGQLAIGYLPTSFIEWPINIVGQIGKFFFTWPINLKSYFVLCKSMH